MGKVQRAFDLEGSCGQAEGRVVADLSAQSQWRSIYGKVAFGFVTKLARILLIRGGAATEARRSSGFPLWRGESFLSACIAWFAASPARKHCKMAHLSPIKESSSMRCAIRRLIVVAAGLAALTLLAARSAAAADNSSFTSQSVPASMGTGTRVFVSLTFMNTGTTSWTVSGGYVLGSPNSANSATWQVAGVALPSPVAAGSSVTFSFEVTAPTTPGTYNFQWQMEDGTTFFGAASTNVSVRVVARPAVSITSPTNGAPFAAPASIPLRASATSSGVTTLAARLVGPSADSVT